MTSWLNGKLGDFITLQRGFDLPEYERKPGHVPVVTSAGISGTHAESKVEGPGVVMGRYGTLGQIYYVEENYWPHNTSLYIKNFKGNYPKFFYYFLKTLRFEAHNDKSSVPGLNRNHLHLVDVLVPPLAEQRAIAAILGALDDKIELNRRQNATLEALARAIFQSWFVDFDSVRAKTAGRAPAAMDAATAALFPDGFEDVAGREVPRGWRVTYLRDVARFVKGLSYKSSDLQESTTALVTLKSIGRGGGYRDEGLKPFVGAYKPEQVVRSGEIVVAHTDLTQAAEVLGRPALIRDHPHYDCLIASLDLMIVRPALEWMSKEFLYDLLSREEFKEHCYGYSNGTTVLHLSVKALPEYSFVLPSNQVIQAFTARSRPIYHKIEQNENQSRTLAALRDTLLPKLLSGEIRVREAERLAEGVV